MSPAQILKDITGISYEIWLAVIIIYYLCATVLPIDAIIGKIYPIFGLSLLVMAVGIGGGLIITNANIPEIAFVNMNPTGRSVFSLSMYNNSLWSNQWFPCYSISYDG